MTLALRIVSLAGFATAIWVLVYTAARTTEVTVTPHLGLRGLKRRRALEQNGLLAAIDPLLRLVARWMRFVPAGQLRQRAAELLERGGDWLGLDPDELLALCALSAAFTLAAGGAVAYATEIPIALLPFCAGLGAALPYFALTGEVARRAKAIDRALPGAIDLGALCMTAGLSFPQALEEIVAKSGDPEDPLNEELTLVLHELRLGWTRARALTRFAERAGTEAVRSFVNAVVQSESRGTPLVNVLQIQATTLRQRRSARGEEAAARAAVLMMLPLMLILVAIVLLLLGPFLLQGMASGL
ncbi:MAG TPA: type II secretion system F family protein [Sandaracinaceae bacterium]